MKKNQKRKFKNNKNEKITLDKIIEEEIKDNSIRNGFSNKVIEYCRLISNKKTRDHLNFTKIPFVTIDGEDSKDFDDAIWSEYKNLNTKIMVAISDVSFFVKKNDPLDLEAKKRGNSFYFPDRVIPMLPEEISNKICSLVPNQERACLIIEVNLKDNGEITSSKFHRAIIKSVGRLTYNEVEEIYNLKKIKNRYYTLIQNLFRAYRILSQSAKSRGKINFNPQEYKIQLDKKNGFVLEKIKKLESYKLIEEFMILANSLVGKLLTTKKVKSIYRNHEKPKKEKINNLKKIFRQLNLNFNKNFNTQNDYNLTIQIIKEKKLDHLNDILLRSQTKAYYDEENKGHFGLGLENYTHFTSPIRRYSDLVVHRDLIEIYFNKNKKNTNSNITSHLTFQEKKADTIERNIIERACSLHLKTIKNYEFKGVVDGIENFGIFIKSIDFPFSGLARIRTSHIKSNQNYSKKKSQKVQKFKIGQLVKFKIKRNNISNGKILLDKVKVINQL